jgi:hypothetical protein
LADNNISAIRGDAAATFPQEVSRRVPQVQSSKDQGEQTL